MHRKGKNQHNHVHRKVNKIHQKIARTNKQIQKLAEYKISTQKHQ